MRLRLPLRSPWVSPLGIMTARDVLLVRVVCAGYEGWGECSAQPEPTFSAEYVDGAEEVMRRHLVPRLLGSGATTGEAVAAAVAAVRGHPMAKAALEAAMLDAELRSCGESLARRLGSVASPPASEARRSVPAGVAVGLSADTGSLVSEVGRHVDAGYRRVKLKIHPGWDAVPLGALRDRWPGLSLQADANGSYAGTDAARRLQALDRLDLAMIEQPLAEDDLVGHARLAEVLDTPICLDESIGSAALAETALALGACRVVCIKPGRVGGLLEAVRVHDRCRAAGVAVWCGGMLETGVGRATNLALAALPGFVLPGDLSASDRFWAQDVVTEPAVLGADGTVAVPDGPGIGVEVRSDLAALTVRREWMAA